MRRGICSSLLLVLLILVVLLAIAAAGCGSSTTTATIDGRIDHNWRGRQYDGVYGLGGDYCHDGRGGRQGQ